MKTLLTITVSVIFSIVGAYALVSYMPLSYFPDVIQRTFGSTILTIQGTDTISSSRSVINANFLALNTDKIEATVTSLASLTSAAVLATVGTITSGTWHGGIVFPTWGGTGSSTLSSNQVLLGNGTGAVNVVNGFGTSGQFLISGGAGVAPSWGSSSVDQTQNYSWTGNHNFVGNTFIKNLNASSTVSIGGVTYSFSLSQGGVNTVAVNDGSGNIVWSHSPRYILTGAAGVSVPGTTVGFATSTVQMTVPAGILTASSTISITGRARCGSNASGAFSCNLLIRTSTGVTLVSTAFGPAASASSVGELIFTALITGTSTTASQQTFLSGTQVQVAGTINSGNQLIIDTIGQSGVNFANANTFTVVTQSPSPATNENEATLGNVQYIVNP